MSKPIALHVTFRAADGKTWGGGLELSVADLERVIAELQEFKRLDAGDLLTLLKNAREKTQQLGVWAP